jgi:hypothetical protein
MDIQTIILGVIAVAVVILHIIFTPKLITHVFCFGIPDKDFEKAARFICVMSVAAILGSCFGDALFG